ncbi:hypothetical protein [Mesorhizobium sp. LNJC405B00]|uniref:hypothetical protein n=1 Tax=unclassified Mesorhizobium TaxID=325217 RepID=UPI0003CF2BEB|nr:hypothetical protein [Mesorhizobium sp. LNJC405B00]ESX98741.1 hypothetical protein X755_15635 [Mesorhizobium sp. LNJC405B00]
MFRMMMFNSFRFMPPPPTGLVVTYKGTFSALATPADPHTFTVDVGAAGTKIVVLVCHGLRQNTVPRTLSSVSVDCTTGTIAVQAGTNDGADQAIQLGIGQREITTGGTITCIADWSQNLHSSAVDVYTITGHTSSTSVNAKSATGNEPTFSNLTVSANGCVIAGATGVNPEGSITFTGVTKDHEELITAQP